MGRKEQPGDDLASRHARDQAHKQEQQILRDTLHATFPRIKTPCYHPTPECRTQGTEAAAFESPARPQRAIAIGVG